MAGVLEEFDEATPLRGTYCSRISAEEYAEQGSQCTEKALSELVRHLESKPEEYKRAMSRKRRQEAEEEGMFSFVKVKLWSLWAGEDAYAVSEDECQEQLSALKEDMMKAFQYSEETKGRRYSKRLAEKRRKLHEGRGTPLRYRSENVPPPPPPPPVPPFNPMRPLSTPKMSTALVRRPLSECNVARRRRNHLPCPSSVNVDAHKALMSQMAVGRLRLKATAEKSPGGTPLSGWPKHHSGSTETPPFFNTKLIDKFKNAKSPIFSPTLASPGSFESPLADCK